MAANNYENDRDALSALFDGELSGDAARFALKRLGHDEPSRAAFGRWQLCGDVLRGQASAVAAGGFAERVAAAIALEQAPAQAQPAPPRSSVFGGRRGWIGGALAASVAVVALFVARPLSNGSSPAAPETAPTQVADAAAPVRAPAVGSRTVPRMPSAPTAPVVDLGTAAVAAAEVPRRAIERRSARSQNQRAAMRASARREASAMEAVASAAPAPAMAAAPGAIEALTASAAPAAAASQNANPFRPQHSEAAPRPWPRAVLPQYSNAGALNASFGGTSPSFYPFEPSMPHETAAEGGERNPPQH
ncbi:sigma-E factor negative regulatory protein [Lysobacter niastensis]|uniref:Sigma-E factor negative regulatory protein n=1 Tax=Lysobacter niastensis TaxID=380629 RepID=A0ABS0B4J7_9GAMM|nr:sigma-E factor negative regulatory protein [Lysobacter niastensis]MBF6023578.1 sigma-E factor negative regulatory protein [Lysobacter niastensis]